MFYKINEKRTVIYLDLCYFEIEYGVGRKLTYKPI